MIELDQRIEIRAMKAALEHYERLGWSVENVSKARGLHAGYDLFLTNGSNEKRVEVKGCSKLYQIPDLYSSEIDPNTMKLIADELCVVYFTSPSNDNQIAIIPRERISSEYISPKSGWRISSRFKKKEYIGPLLVSQTESTKTE
jgi:hypothetical protein